MVMSLATVSEPSGLPRPTALPGASLPAITVTALKYVPSTTGLVDAANVADAAGHPPPNPPITLAMYSPCCRSGETRQQKQNRSV